MRPCDRTTNETPSRPKPRDVIEQFFLGNIRPGSTVLDLGCGDGRLALTIARRVAGTTIECLDGDRVRVRRVESRFRKSAESSRLSCRRGYADELPRLFGRSSFDSVIINNAFHEFWSPVRSLRAARAVLKPRGAILIAELTPQAGETVDDCPRYSRAKIRELIERAGLRVVPLKAGLRARGDAILIRVMR